MALELGCKRISPHGKKLPEVWRKDYKALIKADNLKGLLGCLTYELFGYPTSEVFGYTSAILQIGDGKIC